MTLFPVNQWYRPRKKGLYWPYPNAKDDHYSQSSEPRGLNVSCNSYNHQNQTKICYDIHSRIVIPKLFLLSSVSTLAQRTATLTWLMQEPLILSQGLDTEHWKAEEKIEEIVHSNIINPMALAACLSRVIGVKSSMNEAIDSLTKHKLAINSRFAAYPAYDKHCQLCLRSSQSQHLLFIVLLDERCSV